MTQIFRKDTFVLPALATTFGILAALSIEPFNWPLTAWLTPWPIFYAASRWRMNLKRLFLFGMAAALCLCIFAYYWIMHMLQVFAGMGILTALLIFIPYAVLANLKIPAHALLTGLALRRNLSGGIYQCFLAGSLAVFLDFLMPQIFPWRWGNLIAGNNLLAQFTEISGLYGLNFMFFAGSRMLYDVFSDLLQTLPFIGNKSDENSVLRTLLGTLRRRANLYRLGTFATFAAILLLGGNIRISQMEKLQAGLPVVRTAIIQPNAPADEPGKRIITAYVLRKLMQHTIPTLVEKAGLAAGGKLDLIALPESSIPYLSGDLTPFTRGRIYSAQFELMAQALALRWNAEVYLNETTIRGGRDPLGRYTGLAYNSSALYGRDGKRHGIYHKIKLVAFGEYIPGIGFLKATGLIRLVPGIVRGARFYSGKSTNLLPYMRSNARSSFKSRPPIPAGTLSLKKPREFEKEFKGSEFQPDGYFLPLICYEVLLPNHIRDFFRNRENPDFMLNITQDGWYGKSAERFQHFELGRIRTIETRRALVRSVNGGISGFVDITGRHIKPLAGPIKTEMDAQAFQVWDVPINRKLTTLYVRYGDAWILILLLSFVAVTGFAYYRRR